MKEYGPTVYLDIECQKIVDKNIKKFGYWLFWWNDSIRRSHYDYSLSVCTMSFTTVISIRNYGDGYVTVHNKKYIELARAICKDLEELLKCELTLSHNYNKNEN